MNLRTPLTDPSLITPRLVGYGPPTFSTSMELAVPHRVVWDTNGYYRELGVGVDATRAQIKEAYREKQGWKSARLTYITTQLLDSKVRERYDATPIGMLFLDDYIREAIKRRRMAEVVELRKHGYRDEADILAEADWGFDWGAAEREENLSQRRATLPLDDYGGWPWSYYLWGSHCQDTERLMRWQSLLVEAFWKNKRRYQIAVGFVGMGVPFEVILVGFRQVVFLGESEEPTETLARSAVSRVINQHQRR